MGIFKRLATLEEQNSGLALELVTLKKQMEELEKKLPSYEQAVSVGIDKVWNDALQRVADYNPYKGLNLSSISNGTE